jgi:L-alanine-DL-glutamate epimerase-like enolase superfamily enzyme
MTPGPTIETIKVATALAPLPKPIRFGEWVMTHREFAVCAIRADTGEHGVSFCYTRDAPIAEIVRRNLAPQYVGRSALTPEENFFAAAWSNNAILASGIGYRALSTVDVAAWDLAAKMAGKPIETYLGGEPRPMPVTAIIGYPPTLTPDQVSEQVSAPHAAGWRRFKQPIAATHDLTRERLQAARDTAPDCWLGMDANWVFKTVDDAVSFIDSIEPLGLGWVEDIMPPGNARAIAEVRSRVRTPIAMGDEQGGSYHPEALLAAGAVDVQRLDVTTTGGITRLRSVLDQIADAGVAFAPHMFPHAHSRVLGALGYEVPIEWGVPGTGVDQLSDALTQPTVTDGYMQPLAQEHGIGNAISGAWLSAQELTDPDGLAEEL